MSLEDAEDLVLHMILSKVGPENVGISLKEKET